MNFTVSHIVPIERIPFLIAFSQMTPGFVMSLSRLDKCPMLKEVEASI